MSIDRKILSEIERYRSINKYILEQAAEPAPDDLGALTPDAGAAPPPPPAEAGAVPPPPPGDAAVPPSDEAPTPIDVESDPDVEKIDDEGQSEEKGAEETDSEELDITELVTTQKDTQSKQDEYFENLFGQLGKLESRLGEMDAIMNKLNALENLEYSQISDKLNIPLGTVKSRIFKARKLLQERYKLITDRCIDG